VRIDNYSIADIVSLSIKESVLVFDRMRFDSEKERIALPIIEEIISRLRFLVKVGLPYLTLGRSADTLAGGEIQRLRIAASLGSNLHGVCYILDEPTIGLHPRDNEMLLSSLSILKERGNTVVVVEHDEATIRKADHIIDLGPGGGHLGGRVVFEGRLDEVLRTEDSLTGRYLKRPIPHSFRPRRDPKGAESIRVVNARRNNLKGVDIEIPLHRFVCVTGVSGAGKSSLVRDVLYNGLKGYLSGKGAFSKEFDRIEGWEKIQRVLEVDQSPIGRTPRSCPATYIGVFDEIRRLFSSLPEARARGYGPDRFSFNVKGGRCEICKGAGRIEVRMSFLPDVYIECEECRGRRYNEETLSIQYKKKSIADVLAMDVEEAMELFKAFPLISHPLGLLHEIGLGYITLGQASPTLSGGEAQRIKLTRELAKRGSQTLYILEEPTTGLHPYDIERLIKILHGLVDRGNTVVVIEHNMDIIAEADYIIDLGPEGGDEGGEVVVCGTPIEVARDGQDSHTARFLKEFMERGELRCQG
jgi:excinuclease ABC subunit A